MTMPRLRLGAILTWLLLHIAIVESLAIRLPDLPHWMGSSADQAVLSPVQDDHDATTLRQQPKFPSRPSHPSTGFVAFGDSYSAGIGTGSNTSEDECRRGLNAYPMLIHDDFISRKGIEENQTSFQHLSCTGSTVDDLLSGAEHSQIDAFDTMETADFALLSIGGNDLGFFDIMNSCIFRFYSFYSGTCETALKNSEDQLTGPDFEHRLRVAIMEILDRVRWEKRPWFTIAVTGYARFFNADTNECDDYSFGVWWRGPKLKRELRQRMNDMVLAVNSKVRLSIDAINARFTEPRVFFVDYDAAFEGHRFCEPDVAEPDYKRNETWFFLVGGNDNAPDEVGNVGSTPQSSRPLGEPFTRPVQPIDSNTCLEPAEQSGDPGELATCLMAIAARADPSLRTATGNVVSENSMRFVPTYYGKTFHPRTMGHMAIRDQVYKLWDTLDKSPRRL